MLRIDSSGIWLLCALFAVAVVAAGFGCAEVACVRSCDGDQQLVVRSTDQAQPVRDASNGIVSAVQADGAPLSEPANPPAVSGPAPHVRAALNSLLI